VKSLSLNIQGASFELVAALAIRLLGVLLLALVFADYFLFCAYDDLIVLLLLLALSSIELDRIPLFFCN